MRGGVLLLQRPPVVVRGLHILPIERHIAVKAQGERTFVQDRMRSLMDRAEPPRPLPVVKFLRGGGCDAASLPA